jgi:hypothetical protein
MGASFFPKRPAPFFGRQGAVYTDGIRLGGINCATPAHGALEEFTQGRGVSMLDFSTTKSSAGVRIPVERAR